MEYDAGGATVCVGDERELGVDDFVEVLVIALGEDFGLGLAGGLDKQGLSSRVTVSTKSGAS